tara:strand:- start:953 stop:2089 length:1137 start_codon:yes stop_codon:yes gene_type:complete
VSLYKIGPLLSVCFYLAYEGGLIMAFSTAAGYGNLPNGNFSPIIYSKQVQLAFRKSTVIGDVTNSDYFGEIANQGDTVKIIKEPEISVSAYSRGTQVSAQDLDDEDFTLVVDKANYYAFKMDDIEEAHSHVNFMQLATDRAAHRLADQYDQEVLMYMTGNTQNALHSNVISGTASTDSGTVAVSAAGTDGILTDMELDASDFNSGSSGNAIVLVPRAGGATTHNTTTATTNPLTLIARMSRKLDQQNVDTNNRWLIVDPVFMEILKDEDSRLLNADFGGSGLQNGLISDNLHGFRVYSSNNLPIKGNGPTGTTSTGSTHFGYILAGHSSAVATAEQLNKTETYRDPDSFADIVRGMHLYGRKILRPEALVNAIYVSGI